MLIKRNGKALVYAEIEHVVGTNGCGVIIATEPVTDHKTTIIVTLLYEEMLQIAQAFDDAVGADNTLCEKDDDDEPTAEVKA